MLVKVERLIPYSLSLLSGVLLALSFPRFNLDLLAWIALVPLFFAIQKQSVFRSFLLGWLSGLVYFTLSLSWLSTTMRDFGDLPSYAALGANLLLTCYLSLYIGGFCALLRLILKDTGQSLLFLGPALWVTLEYVKGHLLTGFPWASLAYSQYRNLSMIQIADFGSIYVVAFVIILVNSALYLSMIKKQKILPLMTKPLFIALFVVLLTFVYGKFRLSEALNASNSVSIAVIQGNIGQNQKWDQVFQEHTVDTYLRLSRETLDQNHSITPDLILWPESAMPFIVGTEATHEKALFDFVKKEQVDLLFGAPSMKTQPASQISLFNSAFLLTPAMGIASRYDKIHLVPFGEYVPFPDLFFFVDKFVTGISDFSPGDSSLVMSSAGSRIGVAICYEIIFPDLVRHFVKNGARIMTTITNDAWFGESSAPYQHFSTMVFRAIENRVPFARAANTGISGFVDAKGKIMAQSRLFTEASLTEDLIPGGQLTFYTEYGDLFVALCSLILTFFLLCRLRQSILSP